MLGCSLLSLIFKRFGILEESSSSTAPNPTPESPTPKRQRRNPPRAANPIDPNDPFPYYLRQYFLTPAELSFFHTLQKIVGNQAVIMSKVSLQDIFWVKDYEGEHLQKINRKHVDFLLCDPHKLSAVAGIELDDQSHQRRDRQARDMFVNELFQKAGLPLLRVKFQWDYNHAELSAILQPHLEAAQVVATKSQEAPLCPRCGAVMRLRVTQKPPATGKQFWGCSKYPECRAIVAYWG